MSLDSRQARRFALVSIAIAAVVIALAGSRAHYKLTAHTPSDMPANSRWLFTGRNGTNQKLGLWAACWLDPTQAADHCRIADQEGTAQFDGDMLPLKAHQSAVANKDLKLAAIDPATLWIRGVHGDLPVPMLLLTNGTQLVPVSDLEGLRNRVARGEWQSGLRGTFHSFPTQ
jgi:hypothetical protein